MKEIWTKSKAEYHGDMVDFPEMMAWPKPVQRPYPPILVGGGFPQAARRAIRYGDGWCPVGRFGSSLPDVVEKYRQIARDAGRGLHAALRRARQDPAGARSLGRADPPDRALILSAPSLHPRPATGLSGKNRDRALAVKFTLERPGISFVIPAKAGI